jgi:fucose 4-O-acetylase-like acetyltransferase
MPASSRVKLVDAVKGIAILLVVYGHIIPGLYNRGWWNSPLCLFQSHFIYSFHMPIFFFVAGLFFQRSLAKSGVRQFVTQRLRTVLWPYLFCVPVGIIQLQQETAATPPTHSLLREDLFLFITGQASWFLPTLFLCLMLAMAIHRLPIWGSLVLALSLKLLWPAGVGGLLVFCARDFVYLVVGQWLSAHIERITPLPRWLSLLGASVLFLLVGAGCQSSFSGTRIMAVLLALAGIAAVFLLANAVKTTFIETALVWCGLASLGIFVLHAYVVRTSRIILWKLSTTHAILPNILIPLLFAVVVPGLLWHFRKKLHVGFLFECPWGDQARSSVSRQPRECVHSA